MIAKLLPVGLALAGAGIGVGAGVMFAPEPAVQAAAGEAAGHGETEAPHAAPEDTAAGDGHGEPGAGGAYVRFEQNFVIPVLSEGRVDSMVVLAVTLEVEPGMEKPVSDLQPRLRDRFLRAMLDHANTGGFDGAFTANGAVERLRTALVEVGQAEAAGLRNVLILDINRQEV